MTNRTNLLPLLPLPASIETTGGTGFVIGPGTSISVDRPDLLPIGEYLADELGRSTTHRMPIAMRADRAEGVISLEISASNDLGAEGHRLVVHDGRVTLTALTPEGLHRGTQTLRQLLPSEAGDDSPCIIPGLRVIDYPRWGWRGSMLDVARHFLSVEDVKRHIDLACLYKLNILHLHLTDDQGWRLHIDRWPRLSEFGGSLQVGGSAGGFYTKDDYREIVRYAAERYMTVVPEIDMPGHTQAALASYPELNCDGRPATLYTGTDVGISSLCVDKEITYGFVEDVLAELAELTPGPFIHIGGDEAQRTSLPEYISFVKRVEDAVLRRGKRLIGWEEVAKAGLSPGSFVQLWNSRSAGPALARTAVQSGCKLVMSPSDRAYLDMKYDSSTSLGTEWAGYVNVRRAYEWDPSDYLPDVDESDIVGVEAPLWTETIADAADLEFMVWPRLAGIAEIGWARPERSWEQYRMRLAAQGRRWKAMGVNFFRTPEVPWEANQVES